MSKTLWLVEGIPGSGKSTLAKIIQNTQTFEGGDRFDGYCPHFEADQYFMVKGEYKFEAKSIPAAHLWCQTAVESYMKKGCHDIIVSNTFTRQWEREPYRLLSSKYGDTVFEIICNNNFGNIHGCPPETVQKMKERFEF